MRPLINLEELEDYIAREDGPFQERYAPIADLKYFCLSTVEPHDICEYPDSNKILSMNRQENMDFRHISKADQAVDYMDGEK